MSFTGRWSDPQVLGSVSQSYKHRSLAKRNVDACFYSPLSSKSVIARVEGREASGSKLFC